MLVEGQILEDKYEVRRLVARGGIGEVYLGINRRIDKQVAIKVLHPSLAREQAAVDRFEQEARVAAKIRSAHIADVYDLGDLPSGERFIVMEYLEGETLCDRLEREKRLGEKALATIALQMLDALASAHEAGVVHRDLKPENVFLTKRDDRDFVKLVDFGISKVMDTETRSLTLTGAVLGTPLYMSPEQARGKTVDHRTDLYALGVILYECALGEPPFVGENVNDLLFRVALDNVTPLELRLPSVSPELAAIVRKAMARAPHDRFQSASEMRDAVLEWQATFAAASNGRGSMPSFADGILGRHSPTPTPRPWAVTRPDDDDVEVDLDGIVPRRRSPGRFVAFAMLCGLVALGATHPDQVKTMSSEVAQRAAPIWKAAGSKASAAMAPPPATASAIPSPPPTVVVTDVPPPPSAVPVSTTTPVVPTTMATVVAAPKPFVAPRATVKPPPLAPAAKEKEPAAPAPAVTKDPSPPELDATPKSTDSIF